MSYPEKSYYDTLGIPRNATDTQIKTAYREQMKFFHPDVFQGSPEVAETKSKELNEAYENLIDHEKRDKYDFWLKVKDYQKAQAKQKEERERAARERAERAEAEAAAQRAAEEANRQAQQAAEEEAREAQKAKEEEAWREREAQWAETQQAAPTPAPHKKPFSNAIWAVLLVLSVVAGYMAYQNEHKEVERLQAELDENNAQIVEMVESMVTINELKDFYKLSEEALDCFHSVFDAMSSSSHVLFVLEGETYDQYRQNIKDRVESSFDLVGDSYASCRELGLAGADEEAMYAQILDFKETIYLYMKSFEDPVLMDATQIRDAATEKLFESLATTYEARGFYWELTNPEV